MHQRIEALSTLKGKTAVVLGLGKNEAAAARYLHKRGVSVRVSDVRPRDHLLGLITDLEKLSPPVEMEFGGHTSEVFEGADFVVLSSAISMHTPLVEELRGRGLPVVSEIDLALQEIKTPIITVVGSSGKSSVTAILNFILESSGRKTFLAGDLGHSLSDYLTDDVEADYIILELKAEQLENVFAINPELTVFTVLQPTVSKRFADANMYFRAIMNITRNLTSDSTIVYNYRNPYLRKFLNSVPTKKQLFRRKPPETVSQDFAMHYRGAWFQTTREVIWTNGEMKELFDLRQSRVFGMIYKENLVAAIIAAKYLDLSRELIQAAIYQFPGIPHRLQLVKKKGGVRFINDSRSVSIDTLKKSLEAFPLDPVILIAGGKDTEQDFGKLAELVKKRVKLLVLIGETKEQLNRALGDHTETYLVGTFEEAILMSYQKSRDGDVILFSPGCDAIDMFSDYQDRGNSFIKFLSEI